MVTRQKSEMTDVVVLEARDRVGGRTVNEPIGPGRVVELGGQWVGPGHTEIRRVAAEVGVQTFPTYITGEHLFAHAGRTTRYHGEIPGRMPFGLIDFRIAQARLERLARQIDLVSPASTGRARRHDTLTLETWMRRHMRTRSGRGLMRLTVKAVLATEPSELSLLHWLFYIATGGGLDSLIRTDGGYQQDRFVGGSQEIALLLAADLGDRVHRSSPVRRIEHGPDGLRVHTDTTTVEDARALEELSAGDRRAAVLDRLTELFGPRAAEPNQFHERCWAREQRNACDGGDCRQGHSVSRP